MAQYIANLNTDVPPTDDMFNAPDDLNLFATTDFFDFDMGNDLNRLPGDFEAAEAKPAQTGWQASSGSGSGSNFLDGEFAHFYCFLSTSFYPLSFNHLVYLLIKRLRVESAPSSWVPNSSAKCPTHSTLTTHQTCNIAIMLPRLLPRNNNQSIFSK